MKPLSIFLLLIFFALAKAGAQRALPGFVVKELVKGKTQISWINPYEDCIQLAVQRSTDGARNFRTIFSAQSPELPTNGYVDARVPAGITAYYRIFYVLNNGAYFFSNTQTIGSRQTGEEDDDDGDDDPHPLIPGVKEYVNIYHGDTLLLKLEMKDYKRFKDSVNGQTKDTVYSINTYSASFHPFIAKPVWVPSQYVFTNDRGYLAIRLPQAGQFNYRIVFYELNGAELFQVKAVKESMLILDKSNFVHAGWFEFELYENEKLKEKNRFYLQKD